MNKSNSLVIIKSVLAIILLSITSYIIYKQVVINGNNLGLSLIGLLISTIAFVGFSFFLYFKNQKDLKVAEDLISKNETELNAQKEEINRINLEISENTKLNEQIDKISKTLQSADDLKIAANKVLEELSHEIDICQGVLYITDASGEKKKLIGTGTYAYHKPESSIDNPDFGVGLVGQAALEKKSLYINELPHGYIDVVSGLGSSKPNYLALIPLIYSGDVLGVLEIASFSAFTERNKEFFNRAQETLGAGIHFLSQSKILEELSRKNSELLALSKNEIPTQKTVEEDQNEDLEADLNSEEAIQED